MRDAGYPSNVTLAAASLNVVGGPFGDNANMSTAQAAAAGTPSATPSHGGGLSKGEKDTAIAVPVIIGSLLAAGGCPANMYHRCQGSQETANA